MMRVAIAWFDYSDVDTFSRMSAVSALSFRQVMGIDPDVIRLDGPEKRQQKHWKADNTIKLQGWIGYVERTDDDVLLIDADVLAVKDVRHVFADMDFDVAITTRSPDAYVGAAKIPYNGGVVFVRNNKRALDFLKAWQACNQELLEDGNLHRRYSRVCEGMNQPALVRLLRDCGGTEIATVLELECAAYNACAPPHWKRGNAENVHLLHCKSGLRKELAHYRDSPYRQWVDYYRSFERQLFGDTRPGAYEQVTGKRLSRRRNPRKLTYGGPKHEAQAARQTKPQEQHGGQKNKPRWRVIQELIQDLQDPCGVEVGVWHGSTLFKLLDSMPGLRMAGIDPWQPFDGGDRASQVSADDMQQIYQQVIDKASRRNCEIHRLPSAQAVDNFEDASLDFVFLDGNHRYSSVVQDITKWLPKVRPGGYLIGHDWKHHILGDEVERAVKAVLPGDQVQVDSNVWYYQCK